jgi:hypothetical protein
MAGHMTLSDDPRATTEGAIDTGRTAARTERLVPPDPASQAADAATGVASSAAVVSPAPVRTYLSLMTPSLGVTAHRRLWTMVGKCRTRRRESAGQLALLVPET